MALAPSDQRLRDGVRLFLKSLSPGHGKKMFWFGFDNAPHREVDGWDIGIGHEVVIDLHKKLLCYKAIVLADPINGDHFVIELGGGKTYSLRIRNNRCSWVNLRALDSLMLRRNEAVLSFLPEYSGKN